MPQSAKIVEMPLGLQRLAKIISPRTAQRLFGSFVIEDNSVAQTGFIPKFTLDDGFRKMTSEYLRLHPRRNKN